MMNGVKHGLYMAGMITLLSPTALRADAPAGRYEIMGDTVKDVQTGLNWQRAVDPRSYSWEAAKTYCQSRGAGWRLPVLKELLTLVDPKRKDPAIDVNAFPAAPSTYFWSASPSVPSTASAWIVSFSFGNSNQSDVSDTHRVRCVR